MMRSGDAVAGWIGILPRCFWRIQRSAQANAKFHDKLETIGVVFESPNFGVFGPAW